MDSLQERIDLIENVLIPRVMTELDRYMIESDEYLELSQKLIGYRRERNSLKVERVHNQGFYPDCRVIVYSEGELVRE
jgi:hypothetical protein